MILYNGFFYLVSIWGLLKITLLSDASLKLSTTTPIAVGESVNLSCSSDKDLQETKIVKWTRNNITVLSVIFKNNKRNVLNTTYGYDCDTPTERNFCLNIPASNVTEEQHGSIWQCYIVAGSLSNAIRLNISVPVQNVMLTTTKGDAGNIVIKAGEKVEFSCTAGPSRPAIKEYGIRWFRNNQEIIGKSNITITPVEGNKFITTAKLFIQGSITDEDGDIFCSAWNVHGRPSVRSNSKKIVIMEKPSRDATITGYTTGFRLREDSNLTLNCSVLGGKPLAVLNPPTLEIKLQNTTEHSSMETIRCIGDGEPNNFTITSWTQTIAGTIVRKTTDFDHISEDRAVITLSNVNYEDAGLYTCKATNGIPDRNNIQEQSGSCYLDVKASAKYPSDQEKLKFYGILGKQLSIKVPFYSNPQAIEKQVSWFNKTCNMNSSSSRNTTFSLVDGVNITLTVFGKLVTLQGQAAEMNISTFSKYHLGNYSLKIKNYENLESSTNVIIFPTGPPETPKSFTFLSITSNKIILHWEKGFNGGHKQKFVVNFTETESIKNTVDSRETLEQDSKSDYYLTVNNLNPDTTYNITLYAYNQVGSSSFQSILASTKEKATVSTAVVFGAVAGVSSALILSFITGAILLKKTLARNTGNKDDQLKVRYAISQENDPDEGMKPNIIYESAGPYFAAQSNNLLGNSVFENFVEVPASDREQNAVYAVVKKANKTATNSGASGCAEPDHTYDNWKGDVISNGEKGDAGFIQSKPSRKKNKDGLDYIEVVLKDTSTDQSVRVIHGKENRNDYADIDFSKHADPLPSDDEEDLRP